ncbi:MAG: pentapeptide repeat-containing protein [Leptolyngbya sp. SIOISBB]|nr:pentapeptide repeat-containing protein [Leptolyngbya sp. SIOISBB]
MTEKQAPDPKKEPTRLDKLIEKLSSINFDDFKLIVDEPPKKFLGWPDINWWDIFNALIIPVALACIAFGFQKCSEDNNNQIAQEQREQDLELAEKQREQDRMIAADNQEVQYLNAYIDSMTNLLLQSSNADPEIQQRIQDLLRAETLTVLRTLNGDRKAIVVRLLYEQDLLFVDTAEPDRAFLASTDLRRINLNSTWLYQIDMRRAILNESILENTNFSEAKLDGAVLIGANLSGSTLIGASFTEADLTESNFTHATLIQADFSEAVLDQATFQGASYTDETTDPDVCFSLLPSTIRQALLSELATLNLSDLTEPENGWTLEAVVEQSEDFEDVEAIVTELSAAQTDEEISIFSCPTLFPDDFDPTNHDMTLIQSVELLP